LRLGAAGHYENNETTCGSNQKSMINSVNDFSLELHPVFGNRNWFGVGDVSFLCVWCLVKIILFDHSRFYV
jgi:hypothetical protein